jgi:hypothetical protein
VDRNRISKEFEKPLARSDKYLARIKRGIGILDQTRPKRLMKKAAAGGRPPLALLYMGRKRPGL